MSRFSKLQILSSFLSLIIYLPFINAQSEDFCNNVDTTLPTGPTTTAKFDQCLCQDMIKEAIKQSTVLTEFEDFVGKKKAEEQLDDLILTTSGVQLCHYPAHAIQQCTSANVCAFTCTKGRTLCPDGSCSKSCPSVVLRRQQLPMATAAPEPLCPANQEMCRFGYSFKCVDTQTNLVSCGGCMHGKKASKRGQDCSEIPGVDAVSCLQGVCDVKSCIKGYTFNPDYRNCSLTTSDILS